MLHRALRRTLGVGTVQKGWIRTREKSEILRNGEVLQVVGLGCGGVRRRHGETKSDFVTDGSSSIH